MKSIYAIATMDTKGDEIAYLAQCVRAQGGKVVLVDVGTQDPPTVDPDISRQHVLGHHLQGADVLRGVTDRGQAVTRMSEALVRFLNAQFDAGRVSGVIGVGGSGGTALISSAMQALPIGVPKVLVSTVASGQTAPYVGCSDMAMMFSVTDVAGLNRVSRKVLGNAAHAIAGMALNEMAEDNQARPAIGMTMFGVTTACVTMVRKALEDQGYDVLVFHATGTGGKAMEKLVESGLLNGVMDITTTEVADEVVGGVFKAGPERFNVILEKGLPYVISVGALDMVNFGARDTVPAQFKDRRLHVHNAQVTLMRTTPDENRKFARFMAEKLNRSTAPVRMLLPEKGVSAIDADGQPFHDPEADRALFEELERAVDQNETRTIHRLPLHINDEAFARALVEAFNEVSKKVPAEVG